MLVCMTGGTGFLGAHTVAAAVRAGHRVRLLVRDESAVEPALAPFGVDVDVVVGDVTDPFAVTRAVRGADAVVHMAALYSFDSRDRANMQRVNEGGTAVVLETARRHAGSIVHVSSIFALDVEHDRVLRADSPVARAKEPYLASKAAAEVIAREHQEAGAPVVITYPSALIGPHDSRLGDQNARLRNVLRGLMPIWPTGGFPVGDVRDTATLHARLLDPVPGNRYFGPGRYLSTRDFVRTLRAITGRRLPAVFLPATSMLPVGLLVGLVQRVWPWHIPAEYGAIYTCSRRVRVDENADTNGVKARPVEETVRDTVSWMRDAGWLTARQSVAVA
ncbi:NAD-dependent epimerase/dehydratase family protein [Lentzea sp. PSKA42]|uniref:NAD-dependent epimerase/dehydratase family protein n=2 Tax=Lentzea indica TaxID=2604800 RepID=A0ABX1FXY7_9PSEU|nr:NAD-dependent epimerase/dehydratase family protein [Lentzea indica]